MAPSINKKDIALSFGKAATTYDQAAILQQEVGNRLIERLEYVKINPKNILDLGCGTGYFIDPLKKKYPKAKIIGCDLSLGMLKQVKKKDTFFKKHNLICGDAEHLPLADNSIDFIFSNFAIQWCYDLPQLFNELNRVLSPDGLIMFTTFGPDTLKELKLSWQQVDDYTHVNDFFDMHDIGDALLQSRFKNPVMDAEFMKLTYSKVFGLMKDLKAIGAHNMHENRNHQLTSKSALKKLESAYDTFKQDDGMLPATYEVVYGHAWGNDLPVSCSTQYPNAISIKNIES